MEETFTYLVVLADLAQVAVVGSGDTEVIADGDELSVRLRVCRLLKGLLSGLFGIK